jgi:diguanylate cyclase (GGDEF)-like protein/PAS domain S-box-containing protein
MSEGYGLTIGGRITAVNQALCDLTGFTRDDLIGAATPFPFWPPERLAETSAVRDRIVADQGGTFELTLMRKDGTRFEAEITAGPARNLDGTLLGFVNTFRDVSERKRFEAELERLATLDSLTGLANHRVLHERLREEVTRATRHRRPLSLVILDLDHFKQINDEHGHLVGDKVLQEVARRLAAHVREGEVLARVGGEEFAWILPDADALGAFAAAERARRTVGDRPIPPLDAVTLSAGVCDLENGQSSIELYGQADQSLYVAKQQGRDRTVRYSTDFANRP